MAPKPPVHITGDEADIYEAVLRYQFANNASAIQQQAGTYFIAVQGADPVGSFTRRFGGNTPHVKPASQASITRSGLYDRQTGGKALLFRVDAIRWKSKSTVEVDGGYYEGNLSSSGNTYRLKRYGKTWKVVADVMEWISDARADGPLGGGA